MNSKSIFKKIELATYCLWKVFNCHINYLSIFTDRFLLFSFFFFCKAGDKSSLIHTSAS